MDCCIYHGENCYDIDFGACCRRCPGPMGEMIRGEQTALEKKAALLDKIMTTENESGRPIGVVWDEFGQHCFFCSWSSSMFDNEEPKHDEDCPVSQYRDL